MRRGRLKTRLLTPLVGTIVGTVMTIAGILIVIPDYGPYGFFWTAIAVLILASHVYGLVRTLRRRRAGA